ncbi:MAG: cation:proton antiporter [Solirubrobacterales bacterium]
MDSSLMMIALGLLVVATISKKLSGTPVTAAMVFVAMGILVGPQFIDDIDVDSTGSAVRILAEATLALVLFSDASRISLGELKREASVPARLLGIGLPLTIIFGAAAAALLFDEITVGEAIVVGVILAPTDAALGQAVVTSKKVPGRIRQGLNVESGLNDGICVPLLFAAVAAADIESNIANGRSAFHLLGEEIGFGILAGVAAGLLIARIILVAGRWNLITGPWKQVVPAAGAALAYGLADTLGGSGFIAAFVAGMAFHIGLKGDPEHLNRLTDEVGSTLSGVTLMIFGAVLLGPMIGEITWQIALYAVLSLTVIRMVPVAIAMIGSGARAPTVGFLGWFGPRGLATIVFAILIVEESSLPHQSLLVQIAYLTVGLSVLAHGLTASPLAARYGKWFKANPKRDQSMEGAPGVVSRLRAAVLDESDSPAR